MVAPYGSFQNLPLNRTADFERRSELCEAQETRGSKFTSEFGRNSTAYCFVASGIFINMLI